MMDKDTRNTLRKTVAECRRLLEDAVSQVLEGEFGVHPSGEVEPPDALGELSEEDEDCRQRILDSLEHIQASGFDEEAAVEQLTREVSFTHLNRLCAYKMMESRGLIREAVSNGQKSQGFMFYLADHPEEEKLWTAGRQDAAYQHYLRWLGERFSGEIPALFSPTDLANRLFPPQKVLGEVLDLINDDELAGIWDEDETTGWVYQYFTPKSQREQARKESSAPRNSYELAFRNQLYTPRYVVEFLADNTLGRMWYEMRKGDTSLTDRCDYLVFRPNTVFLEPGEEPPDEDTDDVPEEERLEQPDYVQHRPEKDPREIKILDPACGSGHFLLYCFILLQIIYEEAWESQRTLQQDYDSLEELRKDVPRLILENNLHGIDIDRRAVQMAALALWLRAQRSYEEMELPADERPRITRANLVYAEPMPGEEDMLEEFLRELQPPLLRDLVQQVWNKMELADEAGSLLKIEQHTRGAIARAEEEWKKRDRREQIMLFEELDEQGEPKLKQTELDFTDIHDELFFGTAEDRILETLERYAEHTQNGRRYQRRLFAEDSAVGFRFVELLQKDFDVILMNPPFGAASEPSKDYIDETYPRTKNDVYAAFVERGLELLEDRGMLGAITSRTGFFLTSFQEWREEILLDEAEPTVFADLGYGVLDTAMVETAAYCLKKEY